MDEIEIVMPNEHYFTIDMTRMGIVNNDEVSSVLTNGPSHSLNDRVVDISIFFPSQVLLPLDNPSGNITGTVRRKQRARL